MVYISSQETKKSLNLHTRNNIHEKGEFLSIFCISSQSSGASRAALRLRPLALDGKIEAGFIPLIWLDENAAIKREQSAARIVSAEREQ